MILSLDRDKCKLQFDWFVKAYKCEALILVTKVLLSVYIRHTAVRKAVFSHLCVCRCDPHCGTDRAGSSGRGGEESLEVVLQEQPERSHQKRCTFRGESKRMR